MRLLPLALPVVVIASLTALAASPTRATTVPDLTPAQVADKSDVVVTGVVIASEAAWVGRRIFTFVTLRVDPNSPNSPNSPNGGVLRGALTESERASGLVRIAVPGGEVSGLGQKVSGAPVLAQDARYAVCLSPPNGPGGARGVMYFFAGAWRLDGPDGPRGFDHDGAPVSVPGLLGALRGSAGARAP